MRRRRHRSISALRGVKVYYFIIICRFRSGCGVDNWRKVVYIILLLQVGMSFIVYREASGAAVSAAVLHQLVEVSSRGPPYYYRNRGRGPSSTVITKSSGCSGGGSRVLHDANEPRPRGENEILLNIVTASRSSRGMMYVRWCTTRTRVEITLTHYIYIYTHCTHTHTHKYVRFF